MAQARQVRGPVAEADPALGLTEGDVEDPADAMRDPPTTAHSVSEGRFVTRCAEPIAGRSRVRNAH